MWSPRPRRVAIYLRCAVPNYVRYHAEVAPQPVAETLASVPGVVYAEPVPVNRTHASGPWTLIDPDDPMFSDQTELRHLRLPEAWDVVKGMDGDVVIAIVDGGGEWQHEDLHANVWTNLGEIAGNGVDDDNNGFIDDVHGVNFANEDENDNDPTGLPETPSNANHGTTTAGAASAVSDNGVGISGAAWNAQIMHVNVGCRGADTGMCFGYEGIMYAAANGADIINASWGSYIGYIGNDESAGFEDQSLDLATDMGALVVAAAGNSDLSNDVYRVYPAVHPRVLSVGATEKDTRRKAGFSNYGKLVNVFAPGVDIVTTGSNGRYVIDGGTSLSSPLVAGVAALVKSRFPDISPDALREQVRLSSENMDDANPGLAGRLGRGYVNALAAVQSPTVPGVRLTQWSWEDDDGDGEIASGDVVTVTATVINYLADARQLRVELVPVDPYAFIDMNRSGVDVGTLVSGDSTEVVFEFTVSSDAPTNQPARFHIRIREGNFVDEVAPVSFQINRSLAEVHRTLSAFYTATGGDQWTDNFNWDLETVPDEEELAEWFGVFVRQGWVVKLFLPGNNLIGMLPADLGNLTLLEVLSLESNTLSGPISPELGNLTELQELLLSSNSLSGPIPVELGNLTQLWWLALYSNSLSGPIPAELGNLTGLTNLLLYSNSLSGPIPAELGNLTELQELSLESNTLSGPIPVELGNLTQLWRLALSSNDLSGPIPIELGNLTGLTNLSLSFNSLSGSVPPELGNLNQLQVLGLQDNALTGQLPRSLMQLTNLLRFDFGGQDLCAPSDDAFQTWLSNIAETSGPTCSEGVLHFTGDVLSQTFTMGMDIAPLVLPEGSGGAPPYTYNLTPALPAGLDFDETTRTISGAPAAVTAATRYTWSVTDQDGMSASVTFIIEVISTVDVESSTLPESFTVHGNYPNPFRHSTRLVMDLPWPARVQVDVLDVIGRRVLAVAPVELAAGWGQEIVLTDITIPSGLYLYQLRVLSPEGDIRRAGRFVRVR